MTGQGCIYHAYLFFYSSPCHLNQHMLRCSLSDRFSGIIKLKATFFQSPLPPPYNLCRRLSGPLLRSEWQWNLFDFRLQFNMKTPWRHSRCLFIRQMMIMIISKLLACSNGGLWWIIVAFMGGEETCDEEVSCDGDDNRLNKNAAVQLIAIINGLWALIEDCTSACDRVAGGTQSPVTTNG